MRLLIAAVLLSGCTTAQYERRLASQASGSIGCPGAETAIKDRQYHFTHQTFTAICRGVNFFCRQDTGKPDISCTREMAK